MTEVLRMNYDRESDLPLFIYFPYPLKRYVRSLGIEQIVQPHLSREDRKKDLKEHETFSKLFNIVAERRRVELDIKKEDSFAFRFMNFVTRPFSFMHDFHVAHDICPKAFKKKFYIFQGCRLKPYEWDVLYLIMKHAEEQEAGKPTRFFGNRYKI